MHVCVWLFSYMYSLDMSISVGSNEVGFLSLIGGWLLASVPGLPHELLHYAQSPHIVNVRREGLELRLGG